MPDCDSCEESASGGRQTAGSVISNPSRRDGQTSQGTVEVVDLSFTAGDGYTSSVPATATDASPEALGDGYGLMPWPVPEPRDRGCERSWWVQACDCRTRVYESGCDELSCPTCANHLRARRAAAIRDRFESVRRGRAVIYSIFTVPPELREAAADVKTWTAWRRAMWKILKTRYGGLFAVERTDPAGDSDPGVWHPHLNFLWVQSDGFTPRIDVEDLADAWRGVIGAKRRVSVWTKPSADPGKLGAWYWYMGRTWADWYNAVPDHMRVRWLGSYPKAPKKDTCCPDCGCGYVFLKCGPRSVADEYASAGPAAVRREVDEQELDRLRRSGPDIPWTGFQGLP